ERMSSIQRHWRTTEQKGLSDLLLYGFWALAVVVALVLIYKLYVWSTRSSAGSGKKSATGPKIDLTEEEHRLIRSLTTKGNKINADKLLTSLTAFDHRVSLLLRNSCTTDQDYVERIEAFKELRDKIASLQKNKRSGLPGMNMLTLLSPVTVANLNKEPTKSVTCRIIEINAGKLRLIGLGTAQQISWHLGDLLSLQTMEPDGDSAEILVKFRTLEAKEPGLFLAAFDFPCEPLRSGTPQTQAQYTVTLQSQRPGTIEAQLDSITRDWAHLWVTETLPVGQIVSMSDDSNGHEKDNRVKGMVIYRYSEREMDLSALGVYFPESTGHLQNLRTAKAAAKQRS
ncbi:MAG: hypothetical protein KJ645_08060, partial [Planctomycetes bacterium]|nr:hypothetical protein [Planctomycetota bacterium]